MFKKICLFSLLAVDLQAVTLHTILVGDTMEGEISYSSEFGIDAMRRQATRIASNLGMRLDLVTYEGYHAYPDNVLDYLNNLQVNFDDVIFICFFMHGGRDKLKASKWPDIFMAVQEKIDFGLFVAKAKEKNPKFLFAMAESCNNYCDLPPDFPETDLDDEPLTKELALKYILKRGPFTHEVIDNVAEHIADTTEKEEIEKYRKLFLETSGSIVISTSSPGQFSRRDHLLTGGVFTANFLRTLRQNIGMLDNWLNKDVSWLTILEQAKQKTVEQVAADKAIQIPQFEIDIH